MKIYNISFIFFPNLFCYYNLSRVQKGGLENLAHVNEGEYIDSSCLRNYLSHKNLIYVQQLPDCVAQNNIGSFVLFCIIDLDLNSCWEPGQAGTKKRLILVNMQVEFQAVFYWVFRSMVKFLVLSWKMQYISTEECQSCEMRPPWMHMNIHHMSP